jgi:hypothetical protein
VGSTAHTDEGNWDKPNGRLHKSPFVANGRTSNEDSNLTSPKPTARYEEKDWQTEADAQNPNIDLSKNLLNKKGKDGGINRDQIPEGDVEESARDRTTTDSPPPLRRQVESKIDLA